jgi:hypothetical protein
MHFFNVIVGKLVVLLRPRYRSSKDFRESLDLAGCEFVVK